MCPRCFRLKRAEFDSLRPPRRLPDRFRERVWPVLWRLRPKRRPRLPLSSPCHAKWDRSLEKAIGRRHRLAVLGWPAASALFGLRWSPWFGQSGGLAKLGSGYRQAANFSVPVAQ